MANDTADLFGINIEDIKDKPLPADEASEEEIVPYSILQIIPADGWRAVFVTSDPQRQRLLSLACFALVETGETVEGRTVSTRSVRPMVADEDGEINEVTMFEEFLCLISPQNDPTVPSKALKPIIEAALARRAQIVQISTSESSE